MSTATTQTQPLSPTRRFFPHLSPSRAVVNIIASKRRTASTADLKAKSAAAAPGAGASVNENGSGNASAPAPSPSPAQRRTVSTPAMNVNDKSDGDSNADERQHRQQQQPQQQHQQQSSTGKASTALHRHKLTFPHAADIFVKLRRMQKKVKAHHIESSSGDEPITYPSVLNTNGELDVTRRLARLEIQDEYVCADGVDVAKLLRASRATLLERAGPGPVHVLVDEQWTCSICGPRHRSDGSFRVHIRYAATAATSPNRRDPGQPVALDKISGVPGLMTIMQRDTVALSVVELFEDAQIVMQN